MYREQTIQLQIEIYYYHLPLVSDIIEKLTYVKAFEGTSPQAPSMRGHATPPNDFFPALNP